MPGQVSFTPTQDDWVRANRLWLRYPAGWLRWRRRLGMAMVVLAALALLVDLFLLDRDIDWAISDVASLLLAAAVLMSLPTIAGIFIPRQVRRQFKQRSAMADPVRYNWDEERLHAVTRTGTIDQRWGELHRQLRDAHSFVFLMTDQMMLLIPRRVLSEEQALDLADTADRNGPAPG